MIKNGKTCNEKNRITDRHIKRDDSRKKKVKSIIKLSQVPLTSYKGITKPKKAPLSFKFLKIQIMSGSQDQKERKNCQYCDDNFFQTRNHHSASKMNTKKDIFQKHKYAN